jgi:uncharacterized protein
MASIAIIGTGIAGMGAANALNDQFDITLFEQNKYVGGHTNTVLIEENGVNIPIDTGFIVFNYNTYPNLCSLFAELKVEVKKTDMSFGVQYKPTGLEYSGSSLKHLFAQKRNIFNPNYIHYLLEINRFNETSIEVLDNTEFESCSISDYVKIKGYSSDFTKKYLLPMTGALWSTPTETTLLFPIVSLVRFFKNHGFMGLNTQFQWYTVHNGSHQYRDKLIKPYKDKIQVNNKVIAVKRIENRIELTTKEGIIHTFDKVLFACHADQALAILQDQTANERRLLSPFKYQKNIATLHKDASVMPLKKLTWSAWNYRIDNINGIDVPHCIYHMNRLQNMTCKEDYFLSINDPNLVDKSLILKQIEYEHPIFTVEALKAQKELHLLNEEQNNTFFCGSYFKYGFHEDALASALTASNKISQS